MVNDPGLASDGDGFPSVERRRRPVAAAGGGRRGGQGSGVHSASELSTKSAAVSVTPRSYLVGMKAQVPDLTTDTLERRLVELELWVSRIRAEQLVLLREVDLRQVPLADGCRSLAEWTAGRLDVAPETAKQLVAASTTLQDQPDVRSDLDQGLVSFDRAHQTARLAAAGASNERLAHARGLDIAGLRRLTASLRRMTRVGERELFESRFLALQPNLDSSEYRLWGRLPGTDGETVCQALATRADSFPTLPDGARPNRGQRHADALVSIATDSLTSASGDQESSGPVLSVFTSDQGSVTEGGLSIGPSAVEELLCTGILEHTQLVDGRPLAVGRRTRLISPRLRRYVLWRDGGCAADGCTSGYRLQPHHRIPWSQGGATDPDNLVTLCWFHHHVVIHQMGYAIDPTSPPQRLRFLKPDSVDPP